MMVITGDFYEIQKTTVNVVLSVLKNGKGPITVVRTRTRLCLVRWMIRYKHRHIVMIICK